MSENPTAVPVEQLSFEQARSELAGVVQALESGAAPLEQSLAWWERGEDLAKHCQEILDAAAVKLAGATENGPVAADPASLGAAASENE